MEQTTDQESGAEPEQSILVVRPVSESLKLCFHHGIWVRYATEHGVKKAVTKAFDAYAGPDRYQWSQYKKEPLTTFSFVYSNWSDVRKMVVRTLVQLNPFQHSRPELALATIEWLKKIKPIILRDLAKLSGDTLIAAWEEIEALYDPIYCRVMSESKEIYLTGV